MKAQSSVDPTGDIATQVYRALSRDQLADAFEDAVARARRDYPQHSGGIMFPCAWCLQLEFTFELLADHLVLEHQEQMTDAEWAGVQAWLIRHHHGSE